MNVAAAFVARHRACLALGPAGLPEHLTWVAVTPRFRASAHVVFLGYAPGAPDPLLVAKVSRLAGASAALEREAVNLRAVQAARPGGFDSVPRLLGLETVGDTQLLVETGLPGRVLGAALVRRRPAAYADALLAWTVAMHAATAVPNADRGAGETSYARLLDAPLRAVARRRPFAAAGDALVARTRELTRPIDALPLPLVLEHGDLAAPNLLLSRPGMLGVVDWELAEPRGLPAQDLFFALAWVAFARAGARRTPEYVAAFHGAFFGRDAWARPWVERYAAALRLPREALRPLFVACWSRYVAARMARLLDPAETSLSAETVAWLRQDRFVALWDHAVRHHDALCLAR